MSLAELWEAIARRGAYREGHFLLTSGRHSSAFLLLARAFEWPELGAKIGWELAGLFPEDVATVVGPAMGGVLLAYEVARARRARAIFAEKTADGGMALRRGFRLDPGERVLVVEDVLTTGGSVGKVLELVRQRGAEVVGVGVVVDRSGGKVTFPGLRPRSLFQIDLPAYDPEDCPLCREGLPLEAPKDG